MAATDTATPARRRNSPSRRRLLGALGLGGLLGGGPAWAQAPAGGPASLLYGFPNGGPISPVLDALVAGLAGRYQPELKGPVRYLPGNAGRVAIDALRRGPADGSQMILLPSSLLTLLPQLGGSKGEGVLRELAPVASVAAITFCVAVGPRVPASVRSMADYLAWMQANPDQATVGVPGLNTGAHVLASAIGRRAGATFNFVTFQGTGPLVADLLSGAIASALVIVGAAPEAFASGRLRGLAVTSEARWPSVPDWPTLAELGLFEVPVVETLGLFMHGDTAPGQLEALAAAVRALQTEGRLRELLQRIGMRQPASGGTPEGYRHALLAEAQAWAAVLVAGKLKAGPSGTTVGAARQAHRA